MHSDGASRTKDVGACLCTNIPISKAKRLEIVKYAWYGHSLQFMVAG